MRTYHVFPEAIPRDDLDAGPWTITNNRQGAVQFDKKLMQVPLVDLPCPCGENHAEGTRLHEYGHVAFTPRDWVVQSRAAGLEPFLVGCVEDARLLTRIEGAGLHMDAPICAGSIGSMLTDNLTKGNFDDLIKAFAASHTSRTTRDQALAWVKGIESYDPALIGIVEVMDNAALYLEDLQISTSPGFAATLECAKKLAHCVEAMKHVMTAIKEKADQEEDGEEEVEVEAFDYADDPPPQEGIWGEMAIQRVALTKPARAYPQKKWTAREEGVIPTAMHRIATDGRIFKQPAHRQAPLTVLVDCSGSMSWNWEHLKELLEIAPATTVALYSGDSVNGILRIVAEKGKKADNQYVRAPSSQSNTVDGPALRWLGKHRGRKLWVSDGQVNGSAKGNVHSGSYQLLLEDAAGVVVRKKIMRVKHYKDAMQVVTGKVAFKPSSKKDAVLWAQ